MDTSRVVKIEKETIVQTEFASKDKLCSYVTNEVIYTYLSILMCGMEKMRMGIFKPQKIKVTNSFLFHEITNI